MTKSLWGKAALIFAVLMVFLFGIFGIGTFPWWVWLIATAFWAGVIAGQIGRAHV